MARPRTPTDPRRRPTLRGRRPASALLVLLLLVAPDARAAVWALATDLLSGEPVAGLAVRAGGADLVSGEDGVIPVENGARVLVVTDARYFPVSLPLPEAAGGGRMLDLPVLPRVPLSTSYYRDLPDLLRALLSTNDIEEKMRRDLFVPHPAPMTGGGHRWWSRLPLALAFDDAGSEDLGAREVVRAAAREWEELTERSLFRWATSPQEADVLVRLGEAHSRVRFDRVDPDGSPLHAVLSLDGGVGEEELAAHARHELGHVLLLLGHSEDPAHVMYAGGATRQHVSRDEALAVRVAAALPPGLDLAAYLGGGRTRERESASGSPVPALVAVCVVALIVVLGLQ